MTLQSPYGNPYSQLDENASAQAGAAGGYEMGYVNNENPYTQTQTVGVSGNDDMLEFFAELDEIKKELGSYDANVDRVEQLHARSLSEVNDEQLELVNNQLAAVVEQTRDQGADLRKRIQLLLNHSQRDNTKKNQSENVKRQFQASVQRYQAMENSFRQKFRDRTERQFRTVRPDAADSEVKEAVDEAELGHTQIFAQAIMQSNRRGEAQSALDEVENRHREILLINKTVEELAELFRDLEIMVAEQEAPVQAIEYQANNAQTHIQGAVAQTSKAVESARAARRKKWICFGIIVIICIILAAVLGGVLGSR